VAEFFMTAPAETTPEVFYAKTKQDQADLVWKALFLDRSPLSEATRGVGEYMMQNFDRDVVIPHHSRSLL
jgi:hypothetical protein